jgi:5-dehydro-2-deoxygluconokinase
MTETLLQDAQIEKPLIRHPEGFFYGYTPITKIGDSSFDTGISFGILKLRQDEELTLLSELESAYLLISGECVFTFDDVEVSAKRVSCFNDEPFVLHCAAASTARIRAITPCEFAVSRVVNQNRFATRVYDASNMLEKEFRGRDLLNNTSLRIVRTVFDARNSPDAKLVVGEVVTPPGGWSSYPPHFHDQPEIYHYRFTEPQGYGHAECGDDVFKVRQYDTYKIVDRKEHAQTAAPGYGMYYIWVIRHLDGNPYSVPVFNPEHSWTKTSDANERVWKFK